MEDSKKVEVEKSDRDLKRLEFVRLIAINILVCVSNWYDYAKQNSGPLKSKMETVESAVSAAAVPFYEKFKGVPGDILVFLDDKADELAIKFDQLAPPSAKHVRSKAHSYAETVSEFTQNVVKEGQVNGPSAAIYYAGALYLQFFSNLLLKFWYVAEQFQPIHVVGQMAIPTLAHWTDKYNKTIVDLSAKGYSLFSHFPQVPIDEIAKAYKQIEADQGHVSATCAAE